MAKVYKIVDPSQPGTSKQHPETDWTKYVLCQEESLEVLRCPAQSKCITQGQARSQELEKGGAILKE